MDIQELSGPGLKTPKDLNPWCSKPRPLYFVIFMGNIVVLACLVWSLSTRVDAPTNVDEENQGKDVADDGTARKGESGAAERPFSFDVGGEYDRNEHTM